MAQSAYDVPSPTTFELSIFGAGIGEALAMHLGDNEWFLVDSCVDHRSDEPAALAYLANLGVPLDSVCTIVVTHWHEDHVGGIDRLIARYAKARVHFPAAFKSEDLYELVRAGAEKETLGTEAFQTSKSFAKALVALKANGTEGSIILTSTDKLLRQKVVPKVGDVRVTSLSPSNEACLIALKQYADFVQIDLPARRRPVALDPNHTAIALWVQWGVCRVLLGSDLVDTPDAKLGWKAAITSQILNGDTSKASIVKVAHHGSGNGHSKQFWNKHVNAHAAGLTTYARGPSPPPQPDDIVRLKSCCETVACAPTPSAPRSLKGKATAIFAKSQGIIVTRRVKRFGHVRIRIDPNGQVQTATFGDAGLL